MSQKWTDALTYDLPSLYFHLFRYSFMGKALESLSVKTQPVCSDIALYQLVRREYLRHFQTPVLNFSVHVLFR